MGTKQGDDGKGAVTIQDAEIITVMMGNHAVEIIIFDKSFGL